jgi:hypothetical protein
VALAATFTAVGPPAHSNNADSASANAARCSEIGAQSRLSRSSEIVLHRLTTSTRNPPGRGVFRVSLTQRRQLTDTARHPRKPAAQKLPKTVTAPDNILRCTADFSGFLGVGVQPSGYEPLGPARRLRHPNVPSHPDAVPGKQFEPLSCQDVIHSGLSAAPATRWLLSLSTCVRSSWSWLPWGVFG